MADCRRHPPHAQRERGEQAAHHGGEPQPVCACLPHARLHCCAQALRVARALAPLAAKGGDGADGPKGLLGRARGGSVRGIAGARTLGEAAGHPAAGTGDEREGGGEDQRLVPALPQADRCAPNKGGEVLDKNGSATGRQYELQSKEIV